MIQPAMPAARYSLLCAWVRFLLMQRAEPAQYMVRQSPGLTEEEGGKQE